MEVRFNRSVVDVCVAAYCSGIIEVGITHPVDVVKTRMQLNGTTVLSEVRDIIRTRGYYDGAASRFVGVGLMRLLFWGGMDGTRMLLKDVDVNEYFKAGIIGIGGSCSQILVDGYVEYIKTFNISSKTDNKYSSKSNMKQMVRGLLPTFVRNTGFAIILQVCMKLFTETVDSNNIYMNKLVIPGISGFIASMGTQWLDNVKTIVQSPKNITVMEAIKIVNHTGAFRGSLPRATLGFLNIGIGYFAYRFFYERISEM